MTESYSERMDKLRAKGLKLISQEISPKEHEYQMMDRVKKSTEIWDEDWRKMIDHKKTVEKKRNPILESFFG